MWFQRHFCNYGIHLLCEYQKIYIKCVDDKMNQQRLTWFTWKRLIIILIILIILVLSIYVYSIFRHINASKVDGFDQTESYILSETDMTTINSMYMYQDELLYHIAYAHDKDQEEWLVFVPIQEEKDIGDNEPSNKKDKEDKENKKEEDKELITVKTSDMMSQKEIESAWSDECSECELKSSSPAIIDDTPLWELTYIDKQNRFVMEYRQLEDATTYEQLKLNRKYNRRG